MYVLYKMNQEAELEAAEALESLST